MNKSGIIYKATFPSGKCYIGQTTRKLETRIKEHVRHSHSKLSDMYYGKLGRAIRKYNNKICWEILYDAVPIEWLDNMEKITIAWNNSYKKGYNSTEGGLVWRHTKESKMKIGLASSKRRQSRATRKKISENHADVSGDKNPSKQPWVRDKISKALTGRPKSKLHRKKLSKALMGEKNAKAKVTWKQVREMRKLYATGKYTMTVLSEMFGIADNTIHYIIKNKTWIE